MRLLIIEDDPDIQVILRAVLTRLANCEVDIADDGQEGLRRTKVSRPDAILLDVMLPQMNGYEICKVLKGDPETRSIPVIFLTAAARPLEDAKKAQAMGALGVLAKPFDPMTLIAQINVFLEPEGLAIQENGKAAA